MNLNLVSEDSRLSPAVDLDQASVIFISNRINSPITNWDTNFEVKTVTDDPNRFFYVTKNVSLENPATSLQVYLEAYINLYNDVRVFYALDQTGGVDDCIFVPFPGFSNQDPTREGVILSTSGSDGSSDREIAKTDILDPNPSLNFFREYRFTAVDLSPFNTFRIKIIGTSTNQTFPPQIRNLRSIALA
jgi:hypothetical protein